MAPKLLQKGIVQYLRRVGLLFAFVLAVAISAPSRAVASTYASSVHTTSQNAGPAVDRFLPLSVSESGSQSSAVTAAVDDTLPGDLGLLAYAPGGSQDQEFSDLVRHRGFTKFLLLVFVCGAIIRFFTSPTFLTFITDALDPKAW